MEAHEIAQVIEDAQETIDVEEINNNNAWPHWGIAGE